jgi:2-polyprenyl-6-hydroxyphenyl methylase/3-demethylubiquinone-9 3-methyltransferase
MTCAAAAQHESEVKKGERFEFGKNWQRFLATLTDEKIALAEASLQEFLGQQRLDGKTFLDVGSGSGLFSLVARRLGARVRSFDYDPHSVACTQELRQRYFPDDPEWLIGQGSVLDRDYLASLGTFDVVYSWGVLHHTGAMWQALDNVKSLARIGGQLFIAIYNDLGAVTDRWKKIKQIYCWLPPGVRLAFALGFIAKGEARTVLDHLRRLKPVGYIRRWTDYPRASRGMSLWHDWIDWIGGYPYECATIEEIVDFFGTDGFALERLESRSTGTGCNEFVFRRKAELGVVIDNRLPSSHLLLRRDGHRMAGPFRRSSAGYVATLPSALRGVSANRLILFRNGALVGLAQPGDEPDTIVVAPAGSPEPDIRDTRVEVLKGVMRTIDKPVRHHRGRMYGVEYPDLANLADNTTPAKNTSPIFMFEDSKQLESPHAIHADVVKHGAGRMSHWGDTILFSSTDNSDPRSNGRIYRLVIPDDPTVSEAPVHR